MRLEDGRFVVPLPRKHGVAPLGESRSQAIRRFISFERTLHMKGQFTEFKAVIDEYFESRHAEPVPENDFTEVAGVGLLPSYVRCEKGFKHYNKGSSCVQCFC